jgi:uncharacterized OB-fold protein
MGKPVVGTVIEKAYHPPPGAPDKYWCYIMVETESRGRVNIRLHQKVHDKITIGDRVQFEKPWRKNKRVKDIQFVKS